MIKSTATVAIAACLALVAVNSSFAQRPGRGPGQGPVITQCKDDIKATVTAQFVRVSKRRRPR